MTSWATAALACVLVGAAELAHAQAAPITIAITGESNLRLYFAEQLKQAGGLFAVVATTENPQYVVVIAQESTVGSAAAAVIALDRSGDVATSVVRSGRFSGRGALNACAKELAKRLPMLSKP